MSTFYLVNFNLMNAEELCTYLKDRSMYSIHQNMIQISRTLDAWRTDFVKLGLLDESFFSILKETLSEIESHLRRKETIFYPFVSLLVNRNTLSDEPAPLAQNAITMLKKEYKAIRLKLSQLRQQTDLIDTAACTHKLCIQNLTALFEIEQEIQKQFHIEQTILFPKIVNLEKVVV